MSKIIGVGTDIVEVGRVLKSCEKHSFLNKYYTEAERELIKRRKSCAATNFAGKEAVAKAFGTGFSVTFSIFLFEILFQDFS